ncbi:hypothetical protein L6452_15513 [Arctium lappa]|uniref:Uncharacterized protein n=1 Tax=Arctium lappa TaxID=4217 RepID=A0ACB9CNW3_ARCLA|nr:hypothetical protein L6452_15513 [Arctium lappa]
MYYLRIHNGRCLTFGNIRHKIKATFGRCQKHELNISSYQMCVLMLFNSADRLSYKEIKQTLEIPNVELKLCLQSLACAKEKNVLKSKRQVLNHNNIMAMLPSNYSRKFCRTL